MSTRQTASGVFGVVAFAALLGACSTAPTGTAAAPGSSAPGTAALPGSTTSGASAGPVSSGSAGAPYNPLPAGFAFGSGDVLLRDPATGVAELDGYRATLAESFEGTADGKAVTWWMATTRAETHNPTAREIAVDSSGESAPVQPSRSWLSGGIAYASFGGGACAMSSDPSVLAAGELVNRLPPVLGAVSSGTEQVNGVDAGRSTFDGAAIGLGKAGTASGTIWVASQGGYVVRYELTIKAGADFFGPGIEGTWTARYDLRDVGAVAPIAPPAACGPGPVEAPVMDGATDVLRSSGLLMYEVSGRLDAVKEFYASRAKDLGWVSAHEAQQTDTALVLEYTSNAGRVTLFATVSGGTTTVRIIVAD